MKHPFRRRIDKYAAHIASSMTQLLANDALAPDVGAGDAPYADLFVF